MAEPFQLSELTWIVQTSRGSKIFSDEETAWDFYLMHRNTEKEASPGEKTDNA